MTIAEEIEVTAAVYKKRMQRKKKRLRKKLKTSYSDHEELRERVNSGDTLNDDERIKLEAADKLLRQVADVEELIQFRIQQESGFIEDVHTDPAISPSNKKSSSQLHGSNGKMEKQSPKEAALESAIGLTRDIDTHQQKLDTGTKRKQNSSQRSCKESLSNSKDTKSTASAETGSPPEVLKRGTLASTKQLKISENPSTKKIDKTSKTKTNFTEKKDTGTAKLKTGKILIGGGIETGQREVHNDGKDLSENEEILDMKERQAQEEIAMLKKEVKSMKVQLAKNTAANVAQNKNSEQMISKLKKELTIGEEKKLKFQKQYENLRKKMESLSGQLTEKSELLEKQSNRLKQYEKVSAMSSTREIAAEKKASEKAKEIQELEDKIVDLSAFKQKYLKLEKAKGDLKKTLEEMKSQRVKLDNEFKGLGSNYAKLKKENMDLEKSLKISEKERSKFETLLESANHNVEERSVEINRLENTINELRQKTKELEVLQKEHQNLEKSFKKAEDNCSKYQGLLNTAKEDSRKSASKIPKLESAIVELQKLVKRKNSESALQNSNLDKTIEKMQGFIKRSEELEKENESLMKSLKDARDNCKKYQTQNEDAHRKSAQLDSQIGTLKSTIEEMQCLSKKCEELENEKLSLAKNLSEVKNSSSEIHSKWKEALREAKQNARVMSSLNTRIKELEKTTSKCEQLQKDKKLLKNSLEKVKASHKKFQTMHQKSSRNLKKSAFQISNLKSSITEYKGVEEQSKELETENRNLKMSLESVQGEYTNLQTLYKDAQKESELLSIQISKLEGKVQNFQNLTKEYEELGKKNKTLEICLKTTEEDRAKLQVITEDSAIQIGNFKANIESLTSQCKRVEKEKIAVEESLKEVQDSSAKVKTMYENAHQESTNYALQVLELKSSLKKLKAQSRKMNKEKKNLDKRLTETQNRRAKSEDRCKVANEQLKQSVAKVDELLREKGNTEKSLSEATDSIAKFKDMYELTKEQLEQSVAKVHQFEREKENVDKCLAGARDDRAKFEDMYKAANGQLAQSVVKLQELETGKENTEKCLNEAQDDRAKFKGMFEAANQKLKRSVAKIRKYEIEKKNVEKRLTEAQDGRAKFEDMYNTANGRLEQSVVKFRKLEMVKENAEKQLTEAKNDRAKFKDMYEVANGHLIQSVDKINKFESTIEELRVYEKQCVDLEKKTKSLANSLKKNRASHAKLQKKYEESSSNCKKSAVKILSLERKFADFEDLTKKCSELEKVKIVLEKNVKSTQNSCTKMELKCQELKEQSALLTSKLNRKIDELSSSKKRSDDMEIKNKKLEGTLNEVRDSSINFQNLYKDTQGKLANSKIHISRLEKTAVELGSVREERERLIKETDGLKKQLKESEMIYLRIQEDMQKKNKKLEFTLGEVQNSCMSYQKSYDDAQGKLTDSNLQISKLKNTIGELTIVKEHCDRLEKEKERLQKQLKEADSRLLRLQKDMEKKSKKLELTLSEVKESCMTYRNSYEDASGKLKDSKLIISNLENSVAELSIVAKDCGRLKNENECLRKQLNEAESGFLRFQTMYNDLKGDNAMQLQSNNDKYEKLSKQYADMNEDKKSLEKVLKEAQDGNKKLETDFENAQQDSSHKASLILELENKLKGLTENHEKLKRKKEMQDETLMRVRDASSKVQVSHDEAQRDLKQCRLQISELTERTSEMMGVASQNMKLEKEIKMLQKYLEDERDGRSKLETMYGSASQDLTQSLSQLTGLKGELSDFSKRHKGLKITTETLQKTLEDTEVRCAEQKKMYDDYQKQSVQQILELERKLEGLTASTQKCEQLERDNTCLELQLREAKDSCVSLQTMLDRAKAGSSRSEIRISKLTSSNNSLKKKCEQVSNHKKNLENDLKGAQEEKTKFRNMYKNLQRDSAQSARQLSTLQGTVDVLRGSKKKCKELEKENDSVSQTLKKVSAKCQKLENEKKDLKRTLKSVQANLQRNSTKLSAQSAKLDRVQKEKKKVDATLQKVRNDHVELQTKHDDTCKILEEERGLVSSLRATGTQRIYIISCVVAVISIIIGIGIGLRVLT